MAENKSTDAILVGPGRLSFPSIFERAKDQQTKQETKYEVTLLLPPDTDLAPLKAMLQEAWVNRFGKDPKKWPTGPTVRKPENVIRSCAERPKHFGEFEGWSFISARTDYEPLVRDQTKEKIYEQDGKQRFPRVTADQADLVYAGRWARIVVNAYAYVNKTTGVSLGLEGVFLGRNDTRLAGGGSRADAVADDYDGLAQEMEEETALD
jgi:hypothetical protein